MQMITLTAPQQTRYASTSILPKAPTFGKHALETLSPSYRGSAYFGSSRVVGLSNTQRNDHSHSIVAIQRSCLNDRKGSKIFDPYPDPKRPSTVANSTGRRNT
jgi:hypothetical protein